MDAYEALLTRRSIRQYTRQRVSDELIRQLLVAAMSAPSAGNQQPWHFVVLTERHALDALADALPFGKMLRSAPLGIVVCAETAGLPNPGYWVQDCAAATENLLLAAHALGLGGVWIGVYPVEERVAGLRKLLGLPPHVVPLSAVAIGYPVQPGGTVDRYQEARVHRERW
jgi:nitroreductase